METQKTSQIIIAVSLCNALKMKYHHQTIQTLETAAEEKIDRHPSLEKIDKRLTHMLAALNTLGDELQITQKLALRCPKSKHNRRVLENNDNRLMHQASEIKMDMKHVMAAKKQIINLLMTEKNQMCMQIFVKAPTDTTHVLEVKPTDTIEKVKEKIQAKGNICIPSVGCGYTNEIILCYGGKELELSHYR